MEQLQFNTNNLITNLEIIILIIILFVNFETTLILIIKNTILDNLDSNLISSSIDSILSIVNIEYYHLMIMLKLISLIFSDNPVEVLISCILGLNIITLFLVIMLIFCLGLIILLIKNWN